MKEYRLVTQSSEEADNDGGIPDHQVSLSYSSFGPSYSLGLVPAWFCGQCTWCCYISLFCHCIINTTCLAGCLEHLRQINRGVVSLVPRNLEASRERKGKSVWFVCLVHRTLKTWQWGEREIYNPFDHKEWLFALHNGISYADHVTKGLVVSGASALQTSPGMAVSNSLQTVCSSKKFLP